jgi:hypothetical protein
MSFEKFSSGATVCVNGDVKTCKLQDWVAQYLNSFYQSTNLLNIVLGIYIFGLKGAPADYGWTLCHVIFMQHLAIVLCIHLVKAGSICCF